MCKAFQDLMKEERRNGRKEGEKIGKKAFISKMTDCTKEEYAAAARLN